MRHRSRAKIAFGIAGVCLAIVAAVLAAFLWFHERAANVSPSPHISAEIEVPQDDDGFPEVDWAYWKGVNPDVIGWVTVPGTDVDYPIVQAPANDPTYYLSHDVYRDYNIYGCPYLDAECAEDGLFGSKNAVVFGHHMDDGSMFSSFANYSDKGFAQEHVRILVQTPEEKRVCLVQGADVIPGWEALKRTSFNSPSDFETYYAQRIDACPVKLAQSTDGVDQMMTFCTCSYNYWSWNERTLVYAVEE